MAQLTQNNSMIKFIQFMQSQNSMRPPELGMGQNYATTTTRATRTSTATSNKCHTQKG